jgi:hypothetical protein
MIYPVNIKSDQFILLKKKPYSWQIILPLTAELSKGDKIKLIEVNSINVPTGNELIGVVKFLSNGDLIVSNNKDVLVFCQDVSESIGSLSIGSSLIIL